jgi:thiol-disulfide isomerase/thioredoxin
MNRFKRNSSHFKTLVIGIFSIAFLSCEKPVKKITGTLNNGPVTGKLILKKFDLSNQLVIVDSFKLAKSETFEFTSTKTDPYLYNLYLDNQNGAIQFVWDKNLTINFNTEKPWVSTVNNSPATNAWQKYQETEVQPYRKRLFELSSERNQAASKGNTSLANQLSEQQFEILNQSKLQNLETIKTNPKSFISLYLLFHHHDNLLVNTSQNLLESIEKYWGHHPYYLQIEKYLEKEEMYSDSSEVFFRATSTDDISISLDDYRGQYVIVDFWGTWCRPCVKNIPSLREFYEKNKFKNVKLISVANEFSFDANSQDKFRKFIIQKNMTSWIHIVEQKNDKDEKILTNKFNIGTFPSLIIISPEGEVLKKIVGSSSIEKTLKTFNNDYLN